MFKQITDIRIQRKHSSNRTIFVNREFFCEVDAVTAARLGLRIGMEVDEELEKELSFDEQFTKCKSYAFDLLIRRSYSAKELSDKMKTKGFTPEAINRTLELLEKLGYVKDEKFAKEWVESRIRNKPKGKIALEHELLAKGIDKTTVERVLEEIDDAEEVEIALNLAKKRLKAYKNLNHITVKRRLFSYLLRRGFSSEIVSGVIRKLGM
jgi:regulatory protein